MSDNEDLLGEDLGDHSLADYNLGNEEEEQLLADEYESGPQNVPSSLDSSYGESIEAPASYPDRDYGYNSQPHLPLEPECVVPNIIVEVPNVPAPVPTYAPYEPPPYDERAVPQPVPAAPFESPQIVPSEISPTISIEPPRGRIVSERPPGVQRMPQVRHIPDSLDKVVLPPGSFPQRGRTSWRNPHFNARFSHPYKRNNVYRGNFNTRPSFPPAQSPSQLPPLNNPPVAPIRPEISLERPMGPPISEPQMLPGPVIPPERPTMMRPERHIVPPDQPMMHSERPIMAEMPFRPNLPQERPPFPPNYQRFPFRPNMEEPRPPFGPNVRPNFDRPPFPYQRPPFPRPYGLQVTVRQPQPGMPPNAPKMEGVEPEVRMLPVSLPPNLPPAGLAGKKVLINPHFKGNFQHPEGLPRPTYIPTRIQKSPPISPTLESKFGPIKDIDDAAERFIAEQRNALARAASRNFPRRSPQRYIENTTIEIENDLANPPTHDDDLLRRQEEFINANRAGLRRRMLRSPSPPKRSPSPSPRRRSLSPRRRSPSPRRRPEFKDRPRADDEESEYKRRLREQESLRERVLRAKEVRRRKNAVALLRQIEDKERERIDKERKANEEKETIKFKIDQDRESENKPTTTIPEQDKDSKPDTTRKSPEKITRVADNKVRDRSPIKESAEVNSTCENLTPPREKTQYKEKAPSPERALTPPLPAKRERTDSDDELDLLLDDIEDILSDDDDTGRFKEKSAKIEPKPKPSVDLRNKLPPKSNVQTEMKKPQRQKIVFTDVREERRKRDKSPPKRPAVLSTKQDEAEIAAKKIKIKPEVAKFELSTTKSRQRIVFDNKEAPEKEKAQEKEKDLTQKPQAFSNRRVILQRKATQPEKSVFSRIEIKSDPSKPNPGIFSRAVRTAIGSEKTRIVVKNKTEPEIEYESDSSLDEDKLLEEDLGNIAAVTNLPHGMTDTRLRTLAGNDVQSLILEKEERRAKITFKTTVAAETFKRKFNNKMVAASRLTVVLQ